MAMDTLWQALRQADTQRGLEYLQAYLRDLQAGRAPAYTTAEFFAQCPLTIKDHLSALLCDVLAGYPKSTYGVPVQLLVVPADQEKMFSQYTLPEPQEDAQLRMAGDGMEFIGWAALSDTLPWAANCHPPLIKYGGMHCAIALFAVDIEPGEVYQDEVPVAWWEALFHTEDARVILSAQYAAPYPRAMEIGLVLQDAMAHSSTEHRCHFATHAEIAWAHQNGDSFRRQCEIHRYPHTPQDGSEGDNTKHRAIDAEI